MAVPTAAVPSIRGVVLPRFVPLVSTKAVVAICVVLVPAEAVGAVGVPVSAGDARGALSASNVVRDVVFVNAANAVAKNAVVAILTLLSPAVGVGASGVPVKTGLARGAREASVGWTWSPREKSVDTPGVAVPSTMGVAFDGDIAAREAAAAEALDAALLALVRALEACVVAMPASVVAVLASVVAVAASEVAILACVVAVPAEAAAAS